MKMVPPTLQQKTTGSEAKVFHLLEKIDWAASFAFCSLNLSEHEYKKWGEIDFVIVSSIGLLVLEVKGGQVYCDRGLWRYESYKHAVVERAESPMAQAGSAFFSLREHLYRTVGRRLIDQAVTGFGVIFAMTGLKDAESRGLLGGSEMPPSLVGVKEDLSNEELFASLIGRFFDYWRTQMRQKSKIWSNQEIEEVARALRPWFDRVAPLSISVSKVRQEQMELTAEQYQVLDFCSAADRVMVTGGAGCGKTLLAVECLRRERQRDPMFVTGTESLARHLRASLVSDPSRVYSFSELNQKISARSHVYGSLIVDEGQQITNVESLALLSSYLVGGIERGRWRWFSDPNNQVLPDADFDPAQQERLKQISFPGVLTRNCRTTPQIACTVQLLTGASIGDSTTRGQGPEVTFAEPGSHENQITAAASMISTWLEDPDIKPSDILLLSPKRPDTWSVAQIAERVGLRWRLWYPGWGDSHSNRNCLGAATVEEFRGMESPFVVLCDMDASIENPDSVFYLGMTRANFGLMVVASAPVVQRSALKAASSGTTR